MGSQVLLLTVTWIVAIAMYVLESLAYFKLFKKAQTPHAWMAWIPGFYIFPLLWTIGKSGWNVLWMFVPVVDVVLIIIWMVRFLKSYGQSGHWLWFMLLPYAGPIIIYIKFLQMAFSQHVQFQGLNRGSSTNSEFYV